MYRRIRDMREWIETCIRKISLSIACNTGLLPHYYAKWANGDIPTIFTKLA